MNKHLIINKEIADRIRGKHGKYSEIDPIQITNDIFIIPESILTDCDLIEVREIIGTSQISKTVEEIKLLYRDFQKQTEDEI